MQGFARVHPVVVQFIFCFVPDDPFTALPGLQVITAYRLGKNADNVPFWTFGNDSYVQEGDAKTFMGKKIHVSDKSRMMKMENV